LSDLKKKSQIIATYDYTDEDGNLLYQAVRLSPKDFRQRRPDGKGGWIWKLEDTRRVLYQLPEVIKDDMVFICEGEKDCDVLTSFGLTGTTNPGGAGKWKDEYSEFLKDKTVIILPENDDPGRAHGDDVAKNLQGKAKSTKIVKLPGLPEKGDISDWLETMKLVEPWEIVQSLNELVDKTPEWKEKDDLKPSSRISGADLSSMENDTIEWHSFHGLDGVIGPGISTLLSAHGKTGKSTYLIYVVRDLILHLKVIWLTEEPRSIWIERLEHFPELQSHNLIFYFADGTKWTEQLKRLKTEEADILIIDTARNFCGIIDENDATAWNQAVWPLILMTREKNWALLLIHHLRKSEAAIGLGHAGSHGVVGMVDLAIEMHRDNHSKNRRICRSISRFVETPSEWMIEKNGDELILLGDPTLVSNEELKKRVFEVLDKTPRTRNEITEMLDPVPSRGGLHKALKSLVDEGKVQREGKGVRKNPFVWCLALGKGS